MQNILIVCTDKSLRKDISKVLSKELGFLYVDVDEILDFELLNNQDVALSDAGDRLNELERKSIERSIKFDNCVITISRELFVARDNFKMFNQYQKAFIKLPKAYFVAQVLKDKYSVSQQIEMLERVDKLVEDNCDITINKEVLSVGEMVQQIIQKLK